MLCRASGLTALQLLSNKQLRLAVDSLVTEVSPALCCCQMPLGIHIGAARADGLKYLRLSTVVDCYHDFHPSRMALSKGKEVHQPPGGGG